MKLVSIVVTLSLGFLGVNFAENDILPALIVESIEITDADAYAKLM
jgi:hypothetical protein